MDKVYKEKKIRTFVLLGVIIFGILEIAFIRLVFPSHYTNYLLYIPVYFLILGISVLLVLSRMKRRKLHPGRAIARLMLFNVAQMILSFFVLFIYYHYINIERQVMLVAFCIFYIFFMGVKFFILYHIDKNHKIHKRIQNAKGNK